ncbi:guanylate kinase [Candidatus Nomurabacteria bacterium RIFCSPLOWO2_01_FULL_36_10b]|uniref:Guanylate kinase n=1 Tax=Candidatus Nomurabacteria bacterium RIFCSPLOWO2_01_FULL_36_10b TaxID=1801766 RepID=A0A1F6WQ09_9BACT|nr:MAG: guanylate kinase [Candidatus Nomurabacteria bacterium RIFCSPLOWO2_01_FULL_36_10b]
MNNNKKIIVITGPSGAGKGSIFEAIMKKHHKLLGFSISATTRPPRKNEENGIHYYFISNEQFQKFIDDGAFIEYIAPKDKPQRWYGTLTSEVDRVLNSGKSILLDIEVVGAKNVKKVYGRNSLIISILPPSIEELSERLRKRGTETREQIEERIMQASLDEVALHNIADAKVINDKLPEATEDTEKLVLNFLTSKK